MNNCKVFTNFQVYDFFKTNLLVIQKYYQKKKLKNNKNAKHFMF